jgi:hypothetical protein
MTLENVTREPGAGTYQGYAVEYVDAVPSPGTALVAGTPAQFEVTVRYLLQKTERGTLELTFRDDQGRWLHPNDRYARLDVQKGRWTRATLSKTVMVPTGTYELYVIVPLTPEGVRDPAGALRLRYVVKDRP